MEAKRDLAKMWHNSREELLGDNSKFISALKLNAREVDSVIMCELLDYRANEYDFLKHNRGGTSLKNIAIGATTWLLASVRLIWDIRKIRRARKVPDRTWFYLQLLYDIIKLMHGEYKSWEGSISADQWNEKLITGLEVNDFRVDRSARGK